jgi:hypothetical protein
MALAEAHGIGKHSSLSQYGNYYCRNEFYITGACTIKLFTAVIHGFSQLARMFVPGKPFKPSLMFVGKATGLPESGAPETCFTWVGSGLSRKH